MKREPRIVYISSTAYNEYKSNAGINRMRSFKRGFDKINIDCSIFYIHDKEIQNKLLKKVYAFYKIFNLLTKLEKNDIVIFYGCYNYFIFIFLFRFKLKFIIERNEYPYYLINRKYAKKGINEKLFEFVSNYIDGFITCSVALERYYHQFFKDGFPIHISPLIVDLDKFSNNIRRYDVDFPYIGYCGSLGNNKDGLPILIQSFRLIANEFPTLKLLIAGRGDGQDVDELRKLIDRHELERRVTLTGDLSHNLMPSFLGTASILVLSRPNNKQAEGGMPSKIAEYMAVKVPIVVTRVGELDRFLTDKDNCFMAMPDSIEDFAFKMREALNYDDKQSIVDNAFLTVEQFGEENQARLLSFYLKKL
jgi:glycosyltransferase involved in cell wall biosynthesis